MHDRPLTRLRRFLSRISIRLLAFNVLLVFLPVAFVSYLAIYERQLLRAQERSMVQQGRVLAAALSERGTLSPSGVEPILARLDQRTTARIRVIDRDRRLLSDTSRLGPRREQVPDAPPTDPDLRASWLYRAGSSAFRLLDALVTRPTADVTDEFYDPHRPFDGSEISRALAGYYGAATRITPGGQRSVTLYSALPIRDGNEVVGVVLVSQSTFQILQDLYEVRLAIFELVLGAIGVAAVLSLLLSTTISTPLTRLRAEARALVDRRGRLRGRFRGSERLDEIGDLSRALSELSSRLEERMRFIESFAADVSHELKNPLASIRSAAEMLGEIDDPEERKRFQEIVEADIARIERLLSELQEITRLDAQAEEEDAATPAPVDLNAVLRGVAARERYRELRIELTLADGPLPVAAGPDRMARVFENLLDNALGFSEEGGVRLSSRAEGSEAVVLVEDDGPGIPQSDREKVFDRFFSRRPDEAPGKHSGLGLAIVKSLVERWGGTIRALDSSLGGAAFEVRIPRASP